MRRVLWVLVASVVLIGASFVTVFPTGTYLHQREKLADVSHHLAQVKAQDSALAAQVAKLNTDAEIAYLAKKDYGLVAPGQEAYSVLPSPPTTTPGRRPGPAPTTTSTTSTTSPG